MLIVLIAIDASGAIARDAIDGQAVWGGRATCTAAIQPWAAMSGPLALLLPHPEMSLVPAVSADRADRD